MCSFINYWNVHKIVIFTYFFNLVSMILKYKSLSHFMMFKLLRLEPHQTRLDKKPDLTFLYCCCRVSNLSSIFPFLTFKLFLQNFLHFFSFLLDFDIFFIWKTVIWFCVIEYIFSTPLTYCSYCYRYCWSLSLIVGLQIRLGMQYEPISQFWK